jgi:hypothetical protein
MVNALGYPEGSVPADLNSIDDLHPSGSKAVRGLLLYSRDGNTSDISLLGNSTSFYIGTVYAPDGTIIAGGTSELQMIAGQLIADTVKIGGNTGLNITYDGNVTMYVSTELELHE